jgi:hypothetical protein
VGYLPWLFVATFILSGAMMVRAEMRLHALSRVQGKGVFDDALVERPCCSFCISNAGQFRCADHHVGVVLAIATVASGIDPGRVGVTVGFNAPSTMV